jgi:riboflavin synthase
MFTGLVEDTGVAVAAGASYGAPELPAGAERSAAIIPHTGDLTNLRELAVGDRVNLEADILAKHVEKLVKP